jgi:hypothetical protein
MPSFVSSEEGLACNKIAKAVSENGTMLSSYGFLPEVLRYVLSLFASLHPRLWKENVYNIFDSLNTSVHFHPSKPNTCMTLVQDYMIDHVTTYISAR